MDIFKAAQAGDLPFISSFRTNRGNLNCRDRNGMTPLILAADAGRADVVRLLLELGVEVNAVDKWGQTALMLAAGRNDCTCTELLLKARPDTRVRAGNGLTALGYATDNGNTQTAAILRRAGAR
jgi:ankyrin repeat protein